MNIIRTRFRRDIVAEVAIPAEESAAVVIVCPGMPSGPSKKSLLEFLAQQGYWAVLPRYRGTWESAGTFLEASPADDVCDVISGLTEGFTDFWSGQQFRVKPDHVFLIGASFGGTAAILAAADERVTAAVVLSAVADWQVPSEAEPLDWLRTFVRDAFGEGYRFTRNGWRKLQRGTFFNPARHTDAIPGSKILLIHAADDASAPIEPVEQFSHETGAKLKRYKRGGHFSVSDAGEPRFWRQIEGFLRKRAERTA